MGLSLKRPTESHSLDDSLGATVEALLVHRLSSTKMCCSFTQFSSPPLRLQGTTGHVLALSLLAHLQSPGDSEIQDDSVRSLG